MAARIAPLLLALALLTLTACAEDSPAPARTASPSVSPASSPTPRVSVPSPTATPFPVFEVPEPSFAYAAIDGTIWLASADGSARRQLLPSVGQNADEASRNVAWSPDGRYLSYVAGEGELTLLEVDTGRLIVLDDGSDGLVRSGSGWSPDGQHVAYNKISGDERIPGPLFIAALDGSHWPLPEVTGWGQYLAWSPDGSRIAYAGPAPSATPEGRYVRYGNPLLVTNVDGSGRRHLADSALFHAWSPDGRLIAYWYEEHGGSALVGDICVVDVATARDICLGEFSSDEYPRWAPDPDQYVFHNYRIDPDNGSAAELFKRPGVLVSWSPDANRVAYVEGGHLSQGERSLVILDLINYQATRLHTTNARTHHSMPPYSGDWSHDSRYFAFTAIESEDPEGTSFYIADTASGNITPVFQRLTIYDYPSYSVDRSRVLIVRGGFGSTSIWVANPDGSDMSKLVDGRAIVGFGRRSAWRPAPE